MALLKRFDDKLTGSNTETPKIMDRMKNLYETSKWHDCAFKLWKTDGSGQELIYAHNLILASSSPVFEALCYGPLSEENPIEVPDIDPLAFKMMLKFIYTDCIEFTSVEMACNVLYASKKYLIYSLAGLAISYISDHINESNCLQVYAFANFVQEDRLAKESWSYLCSHLDYVFQYFSYELLTTDLVKNLVNEEALNASEIIIFKICFLWAEAECENNNLQKTSDNIRKLLIKAEILNKIRWLTLSVEEFEEVPKKSGVLTEEEVNVLSKAIALINNNKNVEDRQPPSDNKVPKLNTLEDSNENKLENILSEINFYPYSISSNVDSRKKIQLKKFYCHRFFEKEIRPVLGLQNELKIITYITTNKSVKLTSIFLNAKILPLPNTACGHFYFIGKNYNEKLLVTICDNNDETLFSVLYLEKVCYGTIINIPLKSPVVLERYKEYKIQVDLFNSPENYLFGVRNSVSKFPSGLCVTFKEKANVSEDGRFIERNDLSIISGLELCV